MQPVIVAHIISLHLDAYIQQLAERYPYQPLTAIQNNFLRMSENGQTPRIEDFARRLYSKIKELEEQEDPPFVIQHADGTQDVHRPEEIPENIKKAPIGKPLPERVKKPIPMVTDGTLLDMNDKREAFMELLQEAGRTNDPDPIDPSKK